MQLDKDLTLTKVIKMARQSEEIKWQQTDLTGEMSAGKAEMDAVHVKRGKQHKYKAKKQTQGQEMLRNQSVDTNVVKHPLSFLISVPC